MSICFSSINDPKKNKARVRSSASSKHNATSGGVCRHVEVVCCVWQSLYLYALLLATAKRYTMEITRDSSYNNKSPRRERVRRKAYLEGGAPQKAEQRNVVPPRGCSSFGKNIRGRFFYLNLLPVWVVARRVIKQKLFCILHRRYYLRGLCVCHCCLQRSSLQLRVWYLRE